MLLFYRITAVKGVLVTIILHKFAETRLSLLKE